MANNIKYLDLSGLQIFWNNAKTAIARMDQVTKDAAVADSKKYTDEQISAVGAADITKRLTAVESKASANESNISAEIERSTQADAALNALVGTKGDLASDETAFGRIKQEIDRAVKEEARIDKKIDTEASTRANDITRLEGALNTEQKRAEGKESINANAIAAETARATKAEEANTKAVSDEASRATKAEEGLQAAINSEATTRGEAISGLQTLINKEVTRSTEFDNAIRAELGTKETAADSPSTIHGRLKKAEDAIAKETQDRTTADTNISNLLGTIHDAKDAQTAFGKIAAEASRADAAEKVNAQAVADEVVRAKGEEGNIRSEFAAADTELQGKITTEVNRAKGEESRIESEYKAVDAGLRKDLGQNNKADNSTAFGRIAAIEEQIAGLGSAMHFVGVSKSNPTEGVQIDGKSDYIPKAGDVVLFGLKEYIYQGADAEGKNGKWVEFGDEGSLATQDSVTQAVKSAVEAETNRAKEEEGKIRSEFAAADGKIEAAYKSADSQITTDYKAADEVIRSAFASADSQLETKLTAADNAIKDELVAADNAIKDSFKAADTAIRSEFAAVDTAIRSEFAAADTAMKEKLEQADKAMGEQITVLNQKIENAPQTPLTTEEINGIFGVQAQA